MGDTYIGERASHIYEPNAKEGDHKPFLSPKFDVHAYANAVLSGKAYRPDDEPPATQVNGAGPSTVAKSNGGSGGGDVSVELAKLNYGIEDVTKQLRTEISTSYPLLLAHLTTSLSLSSHLAPIRSSLTSLSNSLDRLHTKIHTPHTQLSLLVRRLTLLAQASDLTRRSARFVLLCRRLEGQMERMKSAAKVEGDKGKEGEGEKDRELAKAALTVAELDSLLEPPAVDPEHDSGPEPIPLQSLDFVKAYVPVVNKYKDTIIQEMESMVISGLGVLNQPLLSSSLQTAHNLRLLPDLVSNLLADLNDAVSLRIKRAFDSGAIAKEVASKEGSQTISKFTRGRGLEPNSSNTAAWVAVLWSRLERVFEDVANCCIKVYTLEKVLKVKRDPITQVEFLEEVMKTLDDKPSFSFWTTLAKSLETQTKEAARSSAWLQTALSTGYPRLLRLFHDFFAKIAVHTDTVYTREHQSPETVLVLRSVSAFETLYLSRSTSRITESVNSALSQYLSARGSPPGPGDGVTIARTVTNELDSAKFDPLLVRTVARNAVRVLEGFTSKVDGMDFTATSLIGPHATPAQTVNAALVGCLYHCRFNLLVVQEDFPGRVWDTLRPVTQSMETAYKRITDALDGAIKRDFSIILGRLHRVDFSKPMDPMAMGGGGSPYMQDLIDKLGFLKAQVLGRISLGDMMRDWVMDLSKYLLRIFLIHASIARPMGESGALKLTSDMTELEVGVSSLLTTGQIQGARGGMRVEKVGDEYMALRAFRTILFSEVSVLSKPVETVHLPPLIVLHHIIVLSPLLLPHEVNGWSEAEYLVWLSRHESPRQQWDLVEKAVNDQLNNPTTKAKKPKANGTKGKEEKGEEFYVNLIKQVLEHARQEDEATPTP